LYCYSDRGGKQLSDEDGIRDREGIGNIERHLDRVNDQIIPKRYSNRMDGPVRALIVPVWMASYMSVDGLISEMGAKGNKAAMLRDLVALKVQGPDFQTEHDIVALETSG
jgi:hypothetical protein